MKDYDETGIYKMLTFVALVLVSVFFIVKTTKADCKHVWVDEDGEVVRTEVCDSVADMPALDTPTVTPIRQPNVTPIQLQTIDIRQCKNAYVYNEDSDSWVTERVCV